MTDKYKQKLKWLLVIPSAILGVLVGNFILHWVLYVTLSNFVEPYPEYPERLLMPFASALGFVLIGAYVAPSKKIKVAKVLSGIWILITLLFVFLAFTGEYFIILDDGLLRPLGGIIGSLVGLFIIKKKFSEVVGTKIEH
jgi:uncharacterized membrane protein